MANAAQAGQGRWVKDMTAAGQITADQLKRLQTLWGQYARHEMLSNSRDDRLHWANHHLRQMKSARLSPISSFKELTLSEASALINLAQGTLGIAESSPSKSKRRYRPALKDRQRAQAAGTEGRNGSASSITIATADDLEMIAQQLSSMGWDAARLDAFLRSPSSPLGKKRSSNPSLRTLGDINRVLWALKRIARKGAINANG